jgi:hypothetical protein
MIKKLHKMRFYLVMKQNHQMAAANHGGIIVRLCRNIARPPLRVFLRDFFYLDELSPSDKKELVAHATRSSFFGHDG